MNAISLSNARQIMEILLESQFMEDKVALDISSLDLKIHIDSISKAEEYKDYEGVKRRYFEYQGSRRVMAVDNRALQLFLLLGDWGYDVDINDVHVCLGTRPLMFGSEYFCQIELSQAVEDDNNIYIIKNISKLTGKGAITRLNNGAISRQQKVVRRDLLVKELNAQLLDNNNDTWIVIHTISKEELFGNENASGILNEFIKAYLSYAFTVEKIVKEN